MCYTICLYDEKKRYIAFLNIFSLFSNVKMFWLILIVGYWNSTLIRESKINYFVILLYSSQEEFKKSPNPLKLCLFFFLFFFLQPSNFSFGQV